MTKPDVLNSYLSSLCRLRQGGTANGPALNKPVLLISLIDLIECGSINSNCISISSELVGVFKENWLLLSGMPYSAELTQPIFHLQNDKAGGKKFWYVQPVLGCSYDGKTRSLSRLRSIVEFCFFSPDLFQLLIDPATREIIKSTLLNHYFSNKRYEYERAKGTGEGYFAYQRKIILNDPETRKRTVIVEASEEDVFVRNGLFKTLINELYDSTCSFSGMRLISLDNHNFIDACHIKPFSVCQEDKIDNGISLCPNLHRAFDRGLISVSQDYRVLIRPDITENINHPYSLKSLEGRKIKLPADSDHYPSQNNLQWHRDNPFRKPVDPGSILY